MLYAFAWLRPQRNLMVPCSMFVPLHSPCTLWLPWLFARSGAHWETPDNRVRAVTALWSQANSSALAPVDWLAGDVVKALQRCTRQVEAEDAAAHSVGEATTVGTGTSHRRRLAPSTGSRGGGGTSGTARTGRGGGGGAGVSRTATAAAVSGSRTEWAVMAARLWRLCLAGDVFPAFAAKHRAGPGATVAGDLWLASPAPARATQADAEREAVDGPPGHLCAVLVHCKGRASTLIDGLGAVDLGPAPLGASALAADGTLSLDPLPRATQDGVEDVVHEALQVWRAVPCPAKDCS